jgi:tetratricopeptide (TPR) repeat protein
VGVGRITAEGFRVRQFFMRDPGEEASVLDALARHLTDFRVLITYNGRAFDQPLLETRYRLNRAPPPFTRMQHVDLLYGARRLWKLRFESCRLVDLEMRILGVEREGDVPGALIPYLYFEYLRTRRAARLLPVFQHNATDILTLACLTGIVPLAFQDPGNAPLRHGAEFAGLARWLKQAGELERARELLRRAIDAGLPDDLLFRSRWDLAQLERKLGDGDTALAMWSDLAAARNPFRVRALEELAKHYEHREKDPGKALEITRQALEHEDSPDLRHRERRLLRRAGMPA